MTKDSTLRRLRHTAGATCVAAALVVLPACGGSSADAEPPTAPDVTVSTAPGSVRLVSPDEASTLIARSGVKLLDVRTPEEYAAGHIDGAQQLDWNAPGFAAGLAGLDKTATWVVYCHTGRRSSQATALMAQEGFTDVNDVEGGIAAWEAAGLPVQTGS
jgi:rhodanese-related sulfurtransferase